MKNPECPAERTQYTHPSIDATISTYLDADMFPNEETEDAPIQELSPTVTERLAMDHQQEQLLHKKPDKKPAPIPAGM